MKFFDYVVREGFYGKNIDIEVCECWSSDGIESASISCPKYSVIPKMLGHKTHEVIGTRGHVIGGIVDRLTVDDVHDAIFEKIFLAEQCICDSLNKKHDDFQNRRHFSIIKEYNGQNIVVDFSLDRHSSNIWVTCPSSAQIKIFSMKDNSYRNEIFSEIDRCKQLIDSGYVFNGRNIFERVKIKIKKLF